MAPNIRAKSANAGSEDANPKQPLIKSKLYSRMHVSKSNDRWVAWVREPKRGGDRVSLGTHLTERLAARCQDRALLKLETESTMTRHIKLNFTRTDYAEDEELRKNKTLAEFIKQLQRESQVCYKKLEPTACLLKFFAEEVTLGNIPSNSLSNSLSNSANSNNKSADEEIDEPSDYDETHEEKSEWDEDDSGDDDEPEDHLKDADTEFQDTANAAAVAANAFDEPLDSGVAADRREPAEVLAPAELLEGNRRRLLIEQPTEDELEVANFLVTEDFRSGWASASSSASDDVLVAAAIMVELQKDPNYSAPVQKESRPKRKQTRRGRR